MPDQGEICFRNTIHKGIIMYAAFFKRFLDFLISLIALLVLSPLLLILTVVGAIAMGGNPFFTQLRPGKKDKNGNEVIFRLIKFRTMSNKKDSDGNLLPDDQRLNAYGRMLRSTSLDELPELLNILCGDLALCGERGIIEATKKNMGFSRVVAVNSDSL